MARLTAKQRAFVEAYCGKARGNASEAARLAGYRNPREMGYQTLTKLHIKDAIAARTQKSLRRMGADDILAALEDLASDAEADKDRLKALELLGKNLGLWTHKVEVTGADGGPIQIAPMPAPDPEVIDVGEYTRQAALYVVGDE